MAQCPDDKGLVMGNAGILRIAPAAPVRFLNSQRFCVSAH